MGAVSAFRDALAAALNPRFVFTAGDGKPSIAVRSGHDLADAILAMPEMVEIHDLLAYVVASYERSGVDFGAVANLPESVIDWVTP